MKTDPTSDKKIFPVVGIGASAGGLEPFKELIKNLPIDTGMAFVFIQHTLPAPTSQLSKILATATQMPLRTAEENMEIQPNHIYVIPADKTAELNGKKFKLSELVRRKAGTREDINAFFSSLAGTDEFEPIGILMSGTGVDGIRGLKEIKLAGGITLAQASDTAEFKDMPEAAMRSGAVDYVLSPGEIGKELARLSEYPYATIHKEFFSGKLAEGDKQAFNEIIQLLENESGVRFSEYKTATLLRRLNRRVLLLRKNSLQEYLDYIKEHPAELDELYQNVLVGTTEFFREAEVFDILKERIYPALLQNRTEQNRTEQNRTEQNGR